jgi:hypothetical protein
VLLRFVCFVRLNWSAVSFLEVGALPRNSHEHVIVTYSQVLV